MPAKSLTSNEQLNAIKTWRYLRLSMAVLVVGLGVAVLYEHRKAHCFQTSISAYYYTPVHGYFVGALLAIGVSLFCLKGSTGPEDILLNAAGMLAPVVALVPTADPGHCASVLGTTADRNANIANNVWALIAVGILAGAILAVLTVRAPGPAGRSVVIGWLVGLFVFCAVALVFWFGRPFFIDHAHWIAAGAMFACIFAVVVVNALHIRSRPDPPPLQRAARRAYIAIAGLMAGASIVIGAAALAGWGHAVIAIEVALIVLFAAFWVIQTVELWDEGLRPAT
jgi:hypothetical protein